MIYALISGEILSGNGISWPIIYDMQYNYVVSGGSTPYLGQPPLLPILFAILGGVTPENFFAAQVINVISHVAISTFSFLIMKKIYDNRSIAVLAGVLLSFSVPMLWNTHFMLSESLFIALTVTGVYFLILHRNSNDHRAVGFLFIASICASASIMTRFAGVALIPVFFWETFVLIKHKSNRARIVSAISAAMLPVTAAGALFARNFIVAGTILGWNPPAPGRSFLDAFTGTLKMIFLQFNLNNHHILLITIFTVFFIVCIFINARMRREFMKDVDSGLDLIVFFMFSYTLLISHAMATSQTVFELRYVSPLVPFLFICFIRMFVVTSDMIRRKGFSKLAVWILILSFGVITFGNFYKTFRSSRALFTKQEGHYLILNSPTYKWIKENYMDHIIITTNRPFHVSFFGGYSTIRLPHRRFNKNYRIPENMESILPERMSKYGSGVLAIFEEADEKHEGRYIAGLFHKRKNDDNFILAHDFSDGVVYKLKE
jgi:hypothetical protein